MFKKMLVAYDGSRESVKALQAGIEMAKSTGAGLCTITVEEGLPPYMKAIETYGAYADPEVLDQVEQRRGAYYKGLQQQAIDIAEAEGVELNCSVVAGGEVNTIVEHARDIGCDLILVGFHAHSTLSDRLLGSTAHAITMSAHCSVLTVK
jgi:nucleotide-binding universal stress UspA family protein